jgi:hypothetical protein
MAVETTTVTPVPRITPFTGISEIQRESSGIARAEVVYTATGQWDAPGAGNNGRGLIFSWDLDRDYGYVLMDCSCLILIAGNYIDMEATSWMEISQELPNSTDEKQYYQLESLPSRQNADVTTAIGDIPADNYNTLLPSGTDVGSMAFNMKYKPTGLLYPFPGVSAISCATVFGEQGTNGNQYSYRYYCRFLQYDIAQGYNYVVSSPVMTR